MNVDPILHFMGRQLGGASPILPEATQDMAFVAFCGKAFSKVGQMLGCRGVVRPIVLIDEKDSLGL
jgi:hypothetical protein